MSPDRESNCLQGDYHVQLLSKQSEDRPYLRGSPFQIRQEDKNYLMTDESNLATTQQRKTLNTTNMPYFLQFLTTAQPLLTFTSLYLLINLSTCNQRLSPLPSHQHIHLPNLHQLLSNPYATINKSTCLPKPKT